MFNTQALVRSRCGIDLAKRNAGSTPSMTVTTPRIPISIQQYATTISVRLFTLAVCFTLIAFKATAQKPAPTANERLPRFEDYSVTEIFKGPPAPPKLRRSGDRLFRTRIREGAAKGPNFAGKFTIAEWGCGSGCVSIAIVDAKDGRIFDAPFSALAWGVPMMTESVEPLAFKLDSRLLIARGCPEEENCGFYYYEWMGTKFKLIRKVAAVSDQK
jgi:hypothetical protein